MEPLKRWNGRNHYYAAADASFHYHHARDEKPDPQHFKPHYEQGCEIYMFLSGSGSYTVEGSPYELEPYSLLMMNSNELHVLNISEDQPYERIVLLLNESLLPPFLLNGVDFFRTIKFRKLGENNQIPAETVRSSGLLDLFGRLQRLLEPSGPRTAENEFVAKCVIVQILSTFNALAESEHPQASRKSSDKVHVVLEYINANLEEDLSLDLLAETFYITKYHLCHTFKEATGYSVNQYITFKRVRMADGLMLQGYSPTQACFMSGFNTYSNFFKSYRKLTGRSPRNGRNGG
ncbi:AraC family transcriptional regulator [Paenibacillus mucilaginosus 3016]|uniref:AraC family transcriptional regulator n=1 Tax=Paenibacillus mucilaginosus 3016 TaxID=1116391 RepID=H6NJV0_9BACL|nr:AraC family transcriptional regulator [Paenibacillus mucilaginosus]AFC30254.1 AraC family transcriptional regulator [Paenibacillus mucilaginosus 3016]WFA18899.1 AraC family transcriptional regulator [Paenibacillus mucilaginosus]